ncbi:MAG: DUF4185 domain-containing protein [Terriglobia bacterium]
MTYRGQQKTKVRGLKNRLGFYIGILLAITVAGAVSLQAQIKAPYPPSLVIQSAKWGFNHLIRLAHTAGHGGSDLWPVTWGADGNIYTSFGDGGGFSGASDGRGRVSIGFARILGFPPHVKGVDLWGAAPKYAKHPATFCGKAGTMLSVNGVLYTWVASWYNDEKDDFVRCPPNPKTPQDRLAWSRDLGATWTLSRWKLEETPGQMKLAGQFLNYGRNNNGARDQYVYQYTIVANDPKATYLIRVLPQDLQKDPRTSGEYEYYAGPGPKWTADHSKARPVFVDPNGRQIMHVVYDRGLRLYIACAQGYGVGAMGLFDAPEPWGPWTTIAYYNNWGHFGRREALGVDFPTKWISLDGKTLWAVFSGGRLKPTDDMLDGFNLVKLTLTLREKQKRR